MLRASTVWVACFTALGATGNEDSALDSPRFPLAHRLVKWVYWTFIASQPSYLLVCLQCFYSQLKLSLPLILQSAKGSGWLIEKSTLSQIEPVTAKWWGALASHLFSSWLFLRFFLHQTFFSQRTEVHVVCNTLKISYDIDLANISETKQWSWTDSLHLESLQICSRNHCTILYLGFLTIRALTDSESRWIFVIWIIFNWFFKSSIIWTNCDKHKQTNSSWSFRKWPHMWGVWGRL